MGRAFEFRRARKEKRWDKMSKAFTKLGREIAMSVKQGGPDPAGNPRLRMAIQNAKGVNMPKEKVESAIKRASAKDAGDYQEMTYEGYAPGGVALVVDCATDNPTRTVANMRMYFSRGNGEVAASGSLNFLFEKKGVFQLDPEGLDMETLELELIDYGAEDIKMEDGEIYIYTQFSDFGTMAKALEERKIVPISASIQRIPTNAVEVPEELEESVVALIEKLEDDDDVQAVYHNMGN
jgi:YebC/PmpR family DNA-binding regulatory protein